MKHLIRLTILAVMSILGTLGCGDSDSGAGSGAAAPGAAAAADPPQQEATRDVGAAQKALTTPVHGNVAGVPFEGTLRITQFVAEDDRVVAVGHITNVTGNISEEVATALQNESHRIAVTLRQHRSARPTSDGDVATSSEALASCDILYLELGPLDLNILGLVVHIDQIVIDIDGDTGAGNLLGNLLCALTALLDPVSFLQNLLQIVAILNQIIDLIGSL